MTSTERTQREIEIFQRRAKSLAARPDAAEDRETYAEIVECRLGGERYGVDLKVVREIQTISRAELCRIPNGPSYVLGLANYRGQALPLLQLASFLSVRSNIEYADLSVVIITRDGSDLGLCFDRIVGVVEVPMSEVDERQTGENLLWISSDRIGLLNLEHLLSERNLG